MSNEKKNMNDINYQQTTGQTEQGASEQTAEQQAFSEEIRRRLAQPDSGKPTLEEFKLLVYKDREKRRKKRNTLVACLIAAFVVGLFSFEYFVPEVGADKNPKETIQTEDGVIIEDGGYGSSIGDENVWVTEDWDAVKDAKEQFTQILIPKCLPKNYVFKKLSIEHFGDGNITCEYFFENNNNEFLEVEVVSVNGGIESLSIDDVLRVLEADCGEIYVQGEEPKKRATTQIGDGHTIHVWGSLSDKELVELVNSFSYID